jgi:predicted enzyme related to lactoylglutathione lyase
MLSEPEKKDEEIRNSIIYFNVADIEKAFEDLRNHHKEIIVDEPHSIAKLGDRDLWMFFVRDFSGNLIGLMEER